MRWKLALHPEFRAEPPWEPPAGHVGLEAGELPARTDALVLGDGFTGPAAALELVRRGHRAVLLDPGGLGADRELGGLGLVNPVLERGSIRRPAVGDADREALEWVESVVAEIPFDCGYRRCGHLFAACTAEDFVRLGEALGPGLEPLPAARQWEEIGAADLAGGYLLEAAGTLDPYRFRLGLLRACADVGVVLGEAHVLSLAGEPGRWSVETSRGRLGTREILVTEHAGAGPLASGRAPRSARRHLLVATEEIPAGLGRMLLRNHRSVSEPEPAGARYRLSPDRRRLLLALPMPAPRGGASPARLAEHAYGQLLARLPQLRGVRLTHAWSAPAPDTGAPEPIRRDGIWSCADGGAAIALGCYCGVLAARALGEQVQGGRTRASRS